jgi:hypothetical protein
MDISNLIATSNKQDITTICLLETPDSLHYESIIHNLLKKYRSNKREIFNCSSDLFMEKYKISQEHFNVFNSLNKIIFNGLEQLFETLMNTYRNSLN